MSTGLGIAALVFGILSIFIPVISLYVVWLALALATIAALSGDKTYSIATFVICLVNVLFLSPATWMAFSGEALSRGSALKVFTIVMFVAPIAGILLSLVRRKGSPFVSGSGSK
jgi:hypothetical protein